MNRRDAEILISGLDKLDIDEENKQKIRDAISYLTVIEESGYFLNDRYLSDMDREVWELMRQSNNIKIKFDFIQGQPIVRDANFLRHMECSGKYDISSEDPASGR